MLTDDRISAAEIRKLGFKVPPNIPDCATVSRASFARGMEIGKSSISGDVLSLDVTLTLDEPFNWVEVKVTASPAAGGGDA